MSVLRRPSVTRNLLKNTSGASFVEYALLVALIAVVAISATTVVGNQLSSKFNAVGMSLSAAGSS